MECVIGGSNSNDPGVGSIEMLMTPTRGVSASSETNVVICLSISGQEFKSF